MLELDDIIPPEIPQPEPVVWPWVVGGVVLAALIAAAVWRVTMRKKSPQGTPAVVSARESFTALRHALATHKNTADSMPGVVHRWINQTLENHAELDPDTIAALVNVRDQLAPHRFLPPARWQAELDTDTITSTLADALGAPAEDPKKGGSA
ncbi:hypothetical protein [Sulfuriroseicoccus oceanibius]|uniref:DUF4381 domain-containing protein n=1 Tax=Sulfuriroseicoccus oceanibius TaxID=2707525 RepID=A0A6B3LFN4_9BACT|nr:hypothetical protein [Sulfuriroseicoccus oceanibius]QQL45172.1 hypothetical protein G3M56_000875 [Sulfuriroseicoccus oceanibius]